MDTAPSVLILAPGGRNASVAASILSGAGIQARMCCSLPDLLRQISEGHCLVITEEALLKEDRTEFAAWIAGQPAWSDFPIVLLTARATRPNCRLAFLDQHAVAVERPFHPSTLITSVRSAIRARSRQLEVKAYIDKSVEVAEQQKLLIRELHHRVKNTLANVQAMMRATAHTTEDIDTFLRNFSARIVSLADTHTMLTDDYWQTASLLGMLTKELQPYDVGTPNRMRIAGPDVHLVSDLAIPLGMAIHELASNSSRYGCLSQPGGQLSVTWTVSAAADKNRAIELEWQERGGPRVTAPSRQGFGTVLLKKVLTVQCGANVDLRYEPEGFSFLVRMPLAERRLVPVY